MSVWVCVKIVMTNFNGQSQCRPPCHFTFCSLVVLFSKSSILSFFALSTYHALASLSTICIVCQLHSTLKLILNPFYLRFLFICHAHLQSLDCSQLAITSTHALAANFFLLFLTARRLSHLFICLFVSVFGCQLGS